jgi:hypothetical protein
MTSQINGGVENSLKLVKEQIDKPDTYYLAIVKESSSQGLYTKFHVDIKLPSTSPFDCIDNDRLAIITKQVELAISQNFQQSGFSPSQYYQAEIQGMKKLEDIIYKYVDCAVCAKNKSVNACKTCDYVDKDLSDFAKANPSIIASAENFVTSHDCTSEAKDFATFSLNLIKKNSTIKWKRLEELYDLIENDPNFLVKNCQGGAKEDPQIILWSDLASFVPSGEVMDRINNANKGRWFSNTWDVQDIKDAKGAKVNLDMFAVRIKKLPKLDNKVLSAEELLSHFRKNINDFAPKFIPYTDYDKTKWFSGNPLHTIMHIIMDIGVDGDVICSQFYSNCWIFTTLRGRTIGGGGYHPVSGNRQFGYYTEIIGKDTSTIIYTKGADRTTTWYHSGGLDSGNFEAEKAFKGADALWTGLQNNLINFVTKNGGEINTNNPTFTIKKRPNWSDVEKLLIQDKPVTSVPCY